MQKTFEFGPGNRPDFWSLPNAPDDIVLCRADLAELFPALENAKRLWVTVSTTSQRGFYRAYYVNATLSIRLWGESYIIVYAADDLLQTIVQPGNHFWFKIQYTEE